MKQYAEHDKVGVCHALRSDEMYVRTFSGGYPYLKDNLILRSSSAQPIYSYGKNYTKGKDKFALFVWTTNNDESSVEEMFKSLAKTVTKEQISEVAYNGAFVYLD